MDCAHVRELLHRSLDGLPTDSTLRDHLAVCAGCRVQLTELRQTARMLGQLGTVAAPPNFLAGVMQTTQARRQAQSVRNPWHRIAPLVASIAALLGVLLLGLSAPPLQTSPDQLVLTTASDELALDLTDDRAILDSSVTETPADTSDLVSVFQGLPAWAEGAGISFLLGLCFLFIAGTATLIGLLAPEPHGAAAPPVRAP